jgi:hypothetical protein
MHSSQKKIKNIKEKNFKSKIKTLGKVVVKYTWQKNILLLQIKK